MRVQKRIFAQRKSSVVHIGSARIRTLAIGISLALTLAPPFVAARASQPRGTYAHEAQRKPSSAHLKQMPNQTWTVKNCDDSGADSLRDIITNPMKAQSGDTVDLSELPQDCMMKPSLITLGSEIVVAQDDLTIQGPSMDALTISGAQTSRIFHHTGTGILSLNALSVTDGYYRSTNIASGGCIESNSGAVWLNHVTVANCVVSSETDWGNGAGVSASTGNVTLLASRVVDNLATGGKGGFGGGVYSFGSTFAKYSTIAANAANDGSLRSSGGGIASQDGVTIIASTVDHNAASYGGGISANGGISEVVESTISGNSARSYAAGIGIWSADSAVVANSTIVFNTGETANSGNGIVFRGLSATDTLTLQSSIVANNTAGSLNVAMDVYISPMHGMLAGADNLVMASNVSDPVVITVNLDPQLDALRFNGGPTRTRMLASGSPARGKGNVAGLPPSMSTDQRGNGYPRETGPTGSVDLGAVQFDSIFSDGFNWTF